MSEWLPEIIAFYQAPIAIGCLYVIAGAVLSRGSNRRGILAIITTTAILAMFTIARPLTPQTVYLGQVPGLQEWLGSIGIAAAAAVLFLRTRQADPANSTAVTVALGIMAFLFVLFGAVGLFLMMAAMNPD